MQFLSYASIYLSDSQVAGIPAVFTIGEELGNLMPVYEKMGKKLTDMHKVEQKVANANNYSYPTIPLWTASNITQPSDSEPLTTSISPTVRSITPEHAESHPANRTPMEELIRFISMSALPPDSSSELDSHESQYNILLKENPEMYSCFREQNPTYQRILSVLQTSDRFYLARLMLWRVFIWGLDIQVQNRFENIKSGHDFYNKWLKVREEEGMRALTVTAYGGQYYQNVPTDVKSMEMIWKGGLKAWTEWKGHLPLTFAEVEKSIASANLPLYTGGSLSRILLYGDLVRMGVLVSPTENEMAKLIVKANGGAMRGLAALGWERNVDKVEEAIRSIRHTLNIKLSPPVKALFHGGMVGVFDVDHILCKVSRRQSINATRSPVWATTRTGRVLKKKGLSHQQIPSRQKGPKKT